MVDFAAIKERQQQAWATGDFAVIGATNVIVGELLCEAVDMRGGQKVLDVATGSGSTALAAARRWCEVTGVDYVPTLLERGRQRAAAEGLPMTFQEGDAEQIPFPDASFEIVLSTFGAMFAPNQEKVASELLRVCRPGGKIGMANWTPEGFIGMFFGIIAHYVPPPPGLNPPVLWGTEERLRELFGDEVASLQSTRRSFVFRYRSVQHWLEVFRTTFGPVMKAFELLDPAGQEGLARDLMAAAHQFNRSGDGKMVVPGEYLEVVAIRR